MRFVQRCCVKDCLNTPHALLNTAAICNRSHVGGKGRRKDVESNHLVLQTLQGSHQGLPQVPGTSGDQYLHDGVIPFRRLRKALFILEPLGVKFGASPDFLLVSVALASSMRLSLMKAARPGSVQRSEAGNSGHGCPVSQGLSWSTAIVDLIDRPGRQL